MSVGQKLAKNNFDGSCLEDTDPRLNGQPGGYRDGAGTPSDVLAYSLEKTDQALQSMIDALKQQGIYDSTLFIVSAKHGQSPINPTKVKQARAFCRSRRVAAELGQRSGGACDRERRRVLDRSVRLRDGR